MSILVNGEEVPPELIRDEAERIKQMQAGALSDDLEGKIRLRQAAERNAIGRVLFRQATSQDQDPIDPKRVEKELKTYLASQGCVTPRAESEARKNIQEQLRAERTIARLVGAIKTPSLAEMERFHRKNRHNFIGQETVKASQIVKHPTEECPDAQAKAVIDSAMADLQSGHSFEDVVARYSDCKQNGGNLGEFSRGVMVDEFDEVVFALRPGERSPVFRTAFGYHIVELKERRPGRPLAFKEVRHDIERVMVFGCRQTAFQQAVQVLLERATIRRVSAEQVPSFTKTTAAGQSAAL